MRFAGQQPGISAFLTEGPDYSALADLGLQTRSTERQTGVKAESNIRVSGLDAMAQIEAATHEARGIAAGGMAQGAASRAQGLSSMFGNIAYGAARFKQPAKPNNTPSPSTPAPMSNAMYRSLWPNDGL